MNVSKQNEDDGISMYLSFDTTTNSDSISSRSTSTYRTIACDDEIASLSDLIDIEDSKGNTTLHNTQKEDESSGIMKDCISVATDIGTKPIMFPNILKEFNAICSTPSKNASPAKTTCFSSDKSLHDKSSKSLVRRSADLSAHFNSLVTEYELQNKENPQPSSSEDSMPSFSKASIIQLQKLNNIAPPTKQEPSRPKPAIKTTLKSIREYAEPAAAIFKNTADKKVKMNSAVRKTLCEPNLLMNRPSRIVSSKKTRFSLATTEMNIGDAATRHAPAAPPPPKANVAAPPPPPPKTSVAAMGLISETRLPSNMKMDKLKKVNDEESNPKIAVMRKSLSSVRTTVAGRKSVALNLQIEKRPTPKRMPPIVKTTLNCAARKTSRPSLSSSNTTVTKRRSVLLLQSKLLQSSLNKRKKPSSSGNSSNDRFTAKNVESTDMAERSSPTKRSLNIRKTLYVDKPDSKFACTECGAFYNVKSLLEAHKKTHRAASPELSKKLQRSVGGGVTTNGMAANNTVNHQCKYCDKNFVLERALHIHLMQHCPKIPAADRRKLNFTEMDHVKKEETPHFRVPPARTTYKPPTAPVTKDPLSNLPVRKPTEVTKIQNIITKSTVGGDKKTSDDAKHNLQNISPSRQAANKQAQMAPPHSTKVKKRSAHTGVYRTPNKDIPCAPCKQSFKSVLDYTNHMMATHATLDASINSLSGQVQ